MAHQAPFCLSYLIAFTSVPMETAVLFSAAEGDVLSPFLLGDGAIACMIWMNTPHDRMISLLGLGGQAPQSRRRCENRHRDEGIIYMVSP